MVRCFASAATRTESIADCTAVASINGSTSRLSFPAMILEMSNNSSTMRPWIRILFNGPQRPHAYVRRQFSVTKQYGPSENCSERGPQFMREHGEKFILCAAGGFGFFVKPEVVTQNVLSLDRVSHGPIERSSVDLIF